MSKHLAKSIMVVGLLLQSLQAEDSFFNFDKLTGTIGKSVNGLLSKDTNMTVEQPVIKKKVAIVLDPVRSPEGFFNDRVLPEFEKMVKSGDIKSYSKGKRTFLSTEYTMVNFDVLKESTEERDRIASLLINRLQANPSKLISSKVGYLLADNLFFGDKTKYHMNNPYAGCVYESSFKWLFKDFQVVDISANPDYVIKIAVDTCLTQSEFEPMYEQYRGLPVKKYGKIDNNTTISGDLVRGGVQAAATTNTVNGDKVGMAMAGVGLALGTVSWLLEPSEKDIVRFKATFEGKNKTTTVFYPTSFSWSGHDWGREVGYSASYPSIRVLEEIFNAWEKNDKQILDKIPVLHTEKDIFKAVAAARDEEAKKKEAK